jgi:hypothetical protein
LDWQIHIEIFAFKGNKFIIPFDLEIWVISYLRRIIYYNVIGSFIRSPIFLRQGI